MGSGGVWGCGGEAPTYARGAAGADPRGFGHIFIFVARGQIKKKNPGAYFSAPNLRVLW